MLLCTYSFTLKGNNLNRSFALFNLASAFYAVGYAFELMSTNLESMLFWSKIQYIGIPFQSGLLIIFTLCYTGHEKRISGFKHIVPMIIPLITLVMRMTNPYHNLFYKAPAVFESGSGLLLSFEPGPFYFLHISYLLFSLVLCTFLFLRFLMKTVQIYRRQLSVIFIALIIQWTALIIYLTGLGPENFDINPFVFTVSSILYAFGIYRYSLLDIIPVARAVVFDEIDDAVLVVNPDMKLVDYNKRCLTLFDNIIEDAVGKNILDLFSDIPEIREALITDDDSEYKVSFKSGSGDFHFKLSRNELPELSDRKTGCIFTFHDITEQHDLMQKLEKLAAVDPLTGIFNRRQFEIQAEIELKRSLRSEKPLSLLIFDIDHFKKVNDTWGHQVGDDVLKAFSDKLSGDIRDIDQIGRFGGEEFLLIMPETGRDIVPMVAERLRCGIEQMSVAAGSGEVRITVSIGISGNWDNLSSSMSELISRADNALYSAKQNGRNRIEISR